ncbi:hypothetical protein AKJ09_03191 [Labilithrix luteola]|uniref:PEGA domain-containing protein n=1 Tax=Labilithrix luteola TaxID=1391654 RepID=A0A0K1PSN2_9BACT|nr:hypothetical protein AKJ09_03191 [Labilithrix luteola]
MVTPVVYAQSPDELKAARELFQEAYRDEQEGRHAQALGKFQRVAQVKETAAVRYRIAAVLESLGRLREARDSFRTVAETAPASPADQPIAEDARQRADALDKRIPHLQLTLDGTPPADARVVVDGRPVPLSTPLEPIEVDPGEHTVSASATGTRTTTRKVVVNEGRDSVVPVSFESSADQASTGGGPNRTLGIVALGAGGALLATSVVLLLVRESDISKLHDVCPGGNCPSSRRDELQSAHDRASLFGPLGIGVGAAGAVAAGIGAYLVLRPSHDEANASKSRLHVASRPLPGGAAVSLGGTF